MSQSLCCGLRFYLREIVGGVVRHCDLVMKIIYIYIFSWRLLVIRENLCSQKLPAIRYSFFA